MKNHMGRISVVIAVMASLLSGCFSHTRGKPMGDLVSQIRKGSTTKAEVVRLLGAPLSTSSKPDGVETLTFTYSKMKSSLLSPIKMEHEQVSIAFKNGVVEDWIYTK